MISSILIVTNPISGKYIVKIPKGGRGKSAPYETQMVRLAVPVKSTVRTIQDIYKTLVMWEESEKAEAMLKVLEDLAMAYYAEKPDIKYGGSSKPDIKYNDGSADSRLDNDELIKQVSEWKQNVEVKAKGWKSNSASQLCKAIQAIDLPKNK